MANYDFTPMKIGNRSLSYWGANLLRYEVGPSEYSNGYLKAQGKIYPVRLKPFIGLRTITIVIDFEAQSPSISADNISDFTNWLQKGYDITLPDGYSYWNVYDGASAPVRKAPWIEQVTFKLHAVRHGPIVTNTYSNQEYVSINVSGNMETPIIVELTPDPSGIMIFNINEELSNPQITITGASRVTINSLDTTVKDEQGNNVFGSTVMTEWPKLKPGPNSVRMSGISGAVISYYPLWK